MNAALQRRARGGLCAVTALVLAASLGGFAGLVRTPGHAHTASPAQSVRTHLAVAPTTHYLMRGALHLAGFDVAGVEHVEATDRVVAASAPALHSTVEGVTQDARGGRGPPAGELA
jgi:hypothetical protein